MPKNSRFVIFTKVLLATLLAFGPALFVSYPSYANDVIQNVSVEISVDEAITTTEITLSSLTEQTTVATAELTATSELLDGISPKQSITDTVNTAITAVDEAVISLTQTAEALEDLKAKDEAYAVAQTLKDLTQINLTEAQSLKDEATLNLSNITQEVNQQQAKLQAEQLELYQLINAPVVANGYTFTTEGYLTSPEPTTDPTTVTLPPMWDAFTKIDVPFDIKLGNTIYEGQGSASQIYVSSKGTITFGQGDFTFWTTPPTAGIYVYHSDWMTAGNGAFAKVTTTDTTLTVEWSLHRFGDSNGPLTTVVWNMDVDPATGEWTGYSEISGNTENLYGGPRIGVRYVNNGTVYEMDPIPVDGTGNQQAIADQQAVVQLETEKLQTLLTTQNYTIAVLEQATDNLDTASENYQQAVLAEEQALAQLVASLENTRMLSLQSIVKVENAVTQTSSAYVIVSNYVDSLPSGEMQVQEGQSLQVITPPNTRVSAVLAWYGAANDPECGASVSTQVAQLTMGKSNFSLDANNSLFGDTCPGVVKTLFVSFTYEAIPAPPKPTPTPEPPVTPTPQPTEQPTTPPTEEPTPQPTEPPVEPTPEPTEEPTVEPTEEPSPQPTPEPTPEEPTELPEEITPEALLEINLDEIVATELTPAQAEALVEAALEIFETAEQGSPEYEQALDALYLASQQDDIVLDEELAAIPLLGDALAGAVELVNLLGNAGSDMSPQVRETSEEVVVAAVIVGQVATVATMAASAPPASGGAPAGGSAPRPSSDGGVPVGNESKAKPKTRKTVKTKAKVKAKTTIRKPRIKFRRSK